MILCIGTSAKIQVVTDVTCTVDVHVSAMDVDNAGNVFTYTKNTAITGATTTDVTAVPGASTTTRNVKTMHIRNKGAGTVIVTVLHVDGVTTVELHRASLQAGDMLQYVEGVGFYEVVAAGAFNPANASSADQTANAADTYLVGSALSSITNFLKVGTYFRWRMTATKTGAGTAAPLWNIRVGTAGTTGDTAVCAFSGFSAQTGATDTGWFDIEAEIRTIGASGVIYGLIRAAHVNATTGMASAAQDQIKQVLSGSVNLSTAGLVIGVSMNPGSLGVWTFQTVSVNAQNYAGQV